MPVSKTIFEAAYFNSTVELREFIEKAKDKEIMVDSSYEEAYLASLREKTITGSKCSFSAALWGFTTYQTTAALFYTGAGIISGGFAVAPALAVHLGKNFLCRGVPKLFTGMAPWITPSKITGNGWYSWNKESWTPLHFAALAGAIDAALILIDNNANLLKKDKHEKGFMEIARQMRHENFVKRCEAHIKQRKKEAQSSIEQLKRDLAAATRQLEELKSKHAELQDEFDTAEARKESVAEKLRKQIQINNKLMSYINDKNIGNAPRKAAS